MVEFIDSHRERFGVEPICRALQFAPSTYWSAKPRAPSARARRDEQLKGEIARVHADNFGVYGAPKVWAHLNREGHRVTSTSAASLDPLLAAGEPSNTSRSRCCDDRLNPANTCPSATQSASPPTTSPPPPAPEETATTTPWPRPSSASTKPSSSATKAPGKASTTSSSPPRNGSTGSTAAAYSTTSAASHQPKPKNSTTFNNTWTARPTYKQNSLRETRGGSPSCHDEGVIMRRVSV